MPADDPSRCVAPTDSGRPCDGDAGASGRCPSHEAELPQPPEGLSDAALALWWSVVEPFELDAHEVALLREACRAQSRCDALAEVIASEGLTATGSKGQPTTHPAVSEVRQQQLVLGRMIAQLRLPEGEADGRPSRATGDGRPQRRGGSRGLYAVDGGAAS